MKNIVVVVVVIVVVAAVAVCPSVGPSVRPSVGQFVGNAFFFQILKIKVFSYISSKRLRNITEMKNCISIRKGMSVGSSDLPSVRE